MSFKMNFASLRRCLVKNRIQNTTRLCCTTSASTPSESTLEFSLNPLTPKIIEEFRKDFDSRPKNLLIQNIGVNYSPSQLVFRHEAGCSKKVDFDIKVPIKKPNSYNKSSPFNWIVQALNLMRTPLIKKYKLPEDFEFSQHYLAFWHKVEAANVWLNNITILAKSGKNTNDRTFKYHLGSAIRENGQWQWLQHLVKKYGIVPKKCYPCSLEEDHDVNGEQVNRNAATNVIVSNQLREYAKALVDLIHKQASDEVLRKTIRNQTQVIYNIICTCMGTPPEKIVFNVSPPKSGGFEEITPINFYQNFVIPAYEIKDKLVIANDPRHPYDKLYRIEDLGNDVKRRYTIFINQPMDMLLEVLMASLKGGEAVLVTYDKKALGDSNCYDIDMFDYRLAFNFDIGANIAKKDRLWYQMIEGKHDLVINAASVDHCGCKHQPVMFGMYDEVKVTIPWLKEYGYVVVVDKKFVPEHVLKILAQSPVSLPAWDIMTLQERSQV